MKKRKYKMRIPIIDNIIMTSDSNNITLNRLMTNDKGKESLSPFAFCSTVPEALERALNEKLGESTARTLKTLLREHDELVGYFKELLGSRFK